MNTIKRKSTANFVLVIMCALATITFTSCNSHEKKMDETQPVADTATAIVDTARLRADWEQFKINANAEINESRDSIESFKTRIARADKKLKANYDRRVAELERKNAELKNKLDDYREEGKEKWDRFKIDFTRDMDNLKQEIKDSTAYSSK